MLVVVDQESLQLVVSLVIILMAQQFIEHTFLHHQVLLVSVPLLALVLLSILWLLVGVELVEHQAHMVVEEAVLVDLELMYLDIR
jgi:hypothetical protein